MIDSPKSTDTPLSLHIDAGCFVQEGRLHAKLSLGCQDACHLVRRAEICVAVICDGTSSTESAFTQNQVGAVLGSHCLASRLANELASAGDLDDARFDAMLKNTEQWTLRVWQSVRPDGINRTGEEGISSSAS